MSDSNDMSRVVRVFAAAAVGITLGLCDGALHGDPELIFRLEVVGERARRAASLPGYGAHRQRVHPLGGSDPHGGVCVGPSAFVVVYDLGHRAPTM